MKLVHTHIIEENTFKFFVQLGTTEHIIKVEQLTDFTGTILEKDFPNGSKSTWNGKVSAVRCKTEKDVVNLFAPKILAEWTNI